MADASLSSTPGRCGCASAVASTPKRVLWIALALNAAMFVVGMAAGLWAQSTGLIADALDMLADALAYGVGLAALNRSGLFKARSATVRGGVLAVLGAGIALEALRRALTGSQPEGGAMMVVALASLAVNATVLGLLSRHRPDDVNMRASYICTRADVIANVGVIGSGLVVTLTGSRFPDLIVGVAIGLYVVKEACEILGEARSGKGQAPTAARGQ